MRKTLNRLSALVTAVALIMSLAMPIWAAAPAVIQCGFDQAGRRIDTASTTEISFTMDMNTDITAANCTMTVVDNAGNPDPSDPNLVHLSCTNPAVTHDVANNQTTVSFELPFTRRSGWWAVSELHIANANGEYEAVNCVTPERDAYCFTFSTYFSADTSLHPTTFTFYQNGSTISSNNGTEIAFRLSDNTANQLDTNETAVAIHCTDDNHAYERVDSQVIDNGDGTCDLKFTLPADSGNFVVNFLRLIFMDGSELTLEPRNADDSYAHTFSRSGSGTTNGPAVIGCGFDQANQSVDTKNTARLSFTMEYSPTIDSDNCAMAVVDLDDPNAQPVACGNPGVAHSAADNYSQVTFDLPFTNNTGRWAVSYLAIGDSDGNTTEVKCQDDNGNYVFTFDTYVMGVGASVDMELFFDAAHTQTTYTQVMTDDMPLPQNYQVPIWATVTGNATPGHIDLELYNEDHDQSMYGALEYDDSTGVWSGNIDLSFIDKPGTYKLRDLSSGNVSVTCTNAANVALLFQEQNTDTDAPVVDKLWLESGGTELSGGESFVAGDQLTLGIKVHDVNNSPTASTGIHVVHLRLVNTGNGEECWVHNDTMDKGFVLTYDAADGSYTCQLPLGRLSPGKWQVDSAYVTDLYDNITNIYQDDGVSDFSKLYFIHNGGTVPGPNISAADIDFPIDGGNIGENTWLEIKVPTQDLYVEGCILTLVNAEDSNATAMVSGRGVRTVEIGPGSYEYYLRFDMPRDCYGQWNLTQLKLANELGGVTTLDNLPYTVTRSGEHGGPAVENVKFEGYDGSKLSFVMDYNPAIDPEKCTVRVCDDYGMSVCDQTGAILEDLGDGTCRLTWTVDGLGYGNFRIDRLSVGAVGLDNDNWTWVNCYGEEGPLYTIWVEMPSLEGVSIELFTDAACTQTTATYTLTGANTMQNPLYADIYGVTASNTDNADLTGLELMLFAENAEGRQERLGDLHYAGNGEWIGQMNLTPNLSAGSWTVYALRTGWEESDPTVKCANAEDFALTIEKTITDTAVPAVEKIWLEDANGDEVTTFTQGDAVKLWLDIDDASGLNEFNLSLRTDLEGVNPSEFRFYSWDQEVVLDTATGCYYVELPTNAMANTRWYLNDMYIMDDYGNAAALSPADLSIRVDITDTNGDCNLPQVSFECYTEPLGFRQGNEYMGTFIAEGGDITFGELKDHLQVPEIYSYEGVTFSHWLCRTGDGDYRTLTDDTVISVRPYESVTFLAVYDKYEASLNVEWYDADGEYHQEYIGVLLDADESISFSDLARQLCEGQGLDIPALNDPSAHYSDYGFQGFENYDSYSTDSSAQNNHLNLKALYNKFVIRVEYTFYDADGQYVEDQLRIVTDRQLTHGQAVEKIREHLDTLTHGDYGFQGWSSDSDWMGSDWDAMDSYYYQAQYQNAPAVYWVNYHYDAGAPDWEQGSFSVTVPYDQAPEDVIIAYLESLELSHNPDARHNGWELRMEGENFFVAEAQYQQASETKVLFMYFDTDGNVRYEELRMNLGAGATHADAMAAFSQAMTDMGLEHNQDLGFVQWQVRNWEGSDSDPAQEHYEIAAVYYNYFVTAAYFIDVNDNGSHNGEWTTWRISQTTTYEDMLPILADPEIAPALPEGATGWVLAQEYTGTIDPYQEIQFVPAYPSYELNYSIWYLDENGYTNTEEKTVTYTPGTGTTWLDALEGYLPAGSKTDFVAWTVDEDTPKASLTYPLNNNIKVYALYSDLVAVPVRYAFLTTDGEPMFLEYVMYVPLPGENEENSVCLDMAQLVCGQMPQHESYTGNDSRTHTSDAVEVFLELNGTAFANAMELELVGVYSTQLLRVTWPDGTVEERFCTLNQQENLPGQWKNKDVIWAYSVGVESGDCYGEFPMADTFSDTYFPWFTATARFADGSTYVPPVELEQTKVDTVVKEVEDAIASGSQTTVEVDMTQNTTDTSGENKPATVVPVEILEAVQGKDVEVELNMGDYSWVINGKEVTGETLQDIDLEVKLDADVIDPDQEAQLPGEDHKEISLTHNGEFGFDAHLKVNVGRQHHGKKGHLYYRRGDGRLEYMGHGDIDEKGDVRLRFNHASDYLVIVGEAGVSAFEGTNIKLDSSLDMSFYVPAELVTNNDSVYALITRNYADGREPDVVEAWPEYYSESLYRFTYHGIDAKEMTDQLSVIVFNGAGIALTEEKIDSVRDYAIRTLEADESDAVKRVVMDMLRYGAAAQEYFGYNTEFPADAETEQWAHYASDTVEYVEDGRVKGENYVGSTVVLENSIVLTMYFENITRDMTALITYTDHYGNETVYTVDGSSFIKRGSMLGVDINSLAVADGMVDVTCQIVSGDVVEGELMEGTTVVASATDSIAYYLTRGGDSLAIYGKVMMFIDSAYDYFETVRNS